MPWHASLCMLGLLMKADADKKTLDIISSRLERTLSADGLSTGWWRALMMRLGVGKRAQYDAAMKRLAQRKVTDTVTESDVQAWLKMFDVENIEHSKRDSSKHSD